MTLRSRRRNFFSPFLNSSHIDVYRVMVCSSVIKWREDKFLSRDKFNAAGSWIAYILAITMLGALRFVARGV